MADNSEKLTGTPVAPGVVRTNYHAHTWRCRHASGIEEEYVLRAIEAGLTEFGFSDHTPYPLAEGYFSGFRMGCEQTAEYVETLLGLREKYKDRIKVLIGFEAEYYPLFFEKLLDHIEPFPYDYIIMGQHFIGNEGVDGIYSGGATDDEGLLKRFADQVCEGLDTGAYSCVAHPDIFNFTGELTVYRRHMERVCVKALDRKVPLEINGLGIRTSRHYPNPRFWELVGEVGNDVVYNCDSHDTPNAWDEDSWIEAHRMAERYGLHLIEKISYHRAR